MLKKLLFIIALFSIAPAMAMLQQIQQPNYGKKVKIQTQDNQIFELNIQYAMLFNTLFNVLQDVKEEGIIPVNLHSSTWQLIETQLNRIFKISVLESKKESRREKVCTYLKNLQPQELIDVLHASNYLDLPELLDCAINAAKQVNLLNVPAQEISALPTAVRNPIVLKAALAQLCPLLITSQEITKEPYGCSSVNMYREKYKVFVTKPATAFNAIINNEKRIIEIWNLNTSMLLAQSAEQTANIELIGDGPHGGSPIRLRTIDSTHIAKRWNIEIIAITINQLSEKIQNINAEQANKIWSLLQQVQQGILEKNEALSQIQVLIGIKAPPISTWQKVIGVAAIATCAWLTYKYFTDDSK